MSKLIEDQFDDPEPSDNFDKSIPDYFLTSNYYQQVQSRLLIKNVNTLPALTRSMNRYSPDIKEQSPIRIKD